MEKKKLVLFDFDGTITTTDTFPLFFKFTFGNLKYYSGFSLFAPLFVLHRMKLYDGGKLKELILSYYLKGQSLNGMQEMGRNFVEFIMEKRIVRQEFLEKINFYKKEGYQVAIVSASPDLWIRVFGEKATTDCLCTELEYSENKFTGKLKTPNCNYLQKKIRVLQQYKLQEYSEIIVYGDSSGDKHMMELATSKIWV